MFICEKCVKKIGAFAIPFSWGRCEECGETENCAEIHHSKWNEWMGEWESKQEAKTDGVNER